MKLVVSFFSIGFCCLAQSACPDEFAKFGSSELRLGSGNSSVSSQNPFRHVIPHNIDLMTAEQRQRYRRIVNTVDRATFPHFKRPSVIAQLLLSRDIVPEGGVVHIVGPASNVEEWFLPLITRTDTKIILFEIEPFFSGLAHYLRDERTLTRIWNRFLESHDYDEIKKVGPVKTFDEFKEQLSKRLSLNKDFGNQRFVESSEVIRSKGMGDEIPKADLIIMNMPNLDDDGMRVASFASEAGSEVRDMIKKQTKPGQSLVWSTSESLRLRAGAPLLEFPHFEMPPALTGFDEASLPLLGRNQGMYLRYLHKDSRLFFVP